MKTLLGIDIGTSSIKAAVLSEDGKVLAENSCAYKLSCPLPARVEIEPAELWRAVLDCVKKLAGKCLMSEICAIGFSTLCPGLLAMDGEGNALTDIIIYSDRRSVKEAEFIKEAAGADRLFAITANGSMAGAFSGSSMLWIKNNLPEIYEKASYLGHINTYLAARLTGRFGMDYSNASYTNVFETAGARRWSEGLCEKIGIDIAKLPALYGSSDVIGGLINKEFISLGISEDALVVLGGSDTACATFASGVVKHGDVCESAGSTDVLTVCVDRPVFGREFINRCHVVPGTWIYQGAMSFAGVANEWFLSNFYTEELDREDKKAAFLAANAEAASAEPGCGGVVFLPYLLGERSPVWDADARGVFFGISPKTTRADMNRAVLEGCGYGLRQLSALAQDISGCSFSRFVSIGGGAKSEVWAQIKADITGRDIDILERADMAPVGAALLAGVGAGVFRSVYEAAAASEKKVWKSVRADSSFEEVYSQRFKVYTGLYPALKELYKLNAPVWR